MLGLTQLSEHSGYLALLAPLVIFGAGNGLAFVPLTTAALDGVDPRDAGAASGLVNVMQQLGGSLGLAVLVTVFGSTSRDVAAHPGAPRERDDVGAARVRGRCGHRVLDRDGHDRRGARPGGCADPYRSVPRRRPADPAVEAEPELRDEVLVGTRARGGVSLHRQPVARQPVAPSVSAS